MFAVRLLCRALRRPTLLLESCYCNTEHWTFSLKWISTNFPKRLLLLFRTVFAFPKASSNGFAAGLETWNAHSYRRNIHFDRDEEQKWILPSTILSSMSWPVPYEVVRYLSGEMDRTEQLQSEIQWFFSPFDMELILLNVVFYQLHEGLVLSHGKQHTWEIAYIRPKYR